MIGLQKILILFKKIYAKKQIELQIKEEPVYTSSGLQSLADVNRNSEQVKKGPGEADPFRCR